MKGSQFSRAVQQLLTDQLHGIEAYTIYTKLAAKLKDQSNAEIITNIDEDELELYRMLTGCTGREMKPRKPVVWWFFLQGDRGYLRAQAHGPF